MAVYRSCLKPKGDVEMNIHELNITSISYRKPEHLNGFVLEFKIDGFQYSLFTNKKENGTIYPKAIVHIDNNSSCLYCEKGGIVCPKLQTHREKLFHRLIEHPSIRLEWLYIDHV